MRAVLLPSAAAVGWLCACCLRAATIDVAPAAVAVAADSTCSLAEAIVNANQDAAVHADCPAGAGVDTLRLAPGSHYQLSAELDSTYGPTGLPLVLADLRVDGRDAAIERPPAATCDLDGSSDPGELRLLAADDGVELTLSDLHLARGCADAPSMGIGNYAGGVLAFRALTLRRVEIAGCQARLNGGGAVFGLNSPAAENLVVVDSVLRDNHALQGGGGLYLADGTATIVATLFEGNSANGQGGGLLSYARVEVTESAFVDNLGVDGAGAAISFSFTTALLRNVTFSGNQAAGRGGALFAGMSLVDLVDATVVTSPGSPGSLAVEGGTLRLRNVVVDGSCTDGADGTLLASGANLETGSTCGAAAGGGFTTVSSAALVLSPLGDHGGPTPTLVPGIGSPMRNAAPDCLDVEGTAIALDQRGYSRPVGSACDLGAVEATSSNLIFRHGFEVGDLWPWSSGFALTP